MTELRVCSYNVRYANPDEGHDVWEFRRAGVTDLVRFHAPDLVGFQEPLPEQVADLEEGLPAHRLVGRGRRADGDGEACPVGARTDRWTITDRDTFWLSETPEEPGAAWGANHPRIVTWARVARAGDEGAEGGGRGPACYLFNTHFDHESARARRESARLLRERVAAIATDAPAVVVGDLNCRPGSEPHRILTDGGLRPAAEAADVTHGPDTSITDFRGPIHGRRIDHVLVGPEVTVEAFATLADLDDRGRHPSDHLPVLARLRI
ncbi:endonuclease/exonuclease/phosphatase family protein [Haloparvum alkalitolerans]|uniref:endonuclease/exonuclease/phosphatase family protein n=1 Tax=Haloparvum alkalitolerans TaxID=1042953 RepID=UPI003CFAABDC